MPHQMKMLNLEKQGLKLDPGDLYKSNGTGLTRLTNHANFDYIPAFSSDGTKIIFISNRTGPADVFIMNADGTGVTQITSDASTEWAPTFQP